MKYVPVVDTEYGLLMFYMELLMDCKHPIRPKRYMWGSYSAQKVEGKHSRRRARWRRPSVAGATTQTPLEEEERFVLGSWTIAAIVIGRMSNLRPRKTADNQEY